MDDSVEVHSCALKNLRNLFEGFDVAERADGIAPSLEGLGRDARPDCQRGTTPRNDLESRRFT